MEKQLKRWHATLPAERATKGEIIQALSQMGFKKYCFQRELSESKYEHWQIRASGNKPWRLPELINTCSIKGMHWSAESSKGNPFYCMKQDTRIEGPFTDRDSVPYIPTKYRNLKLRPHQEKIVEMMMKQNDRQILFIIDTEGNTGKSTLRTYLEIYCNGINIPSSIQSSEDIMQLVHGIVHDAPFKTYNICLDIPRSMPTEGHWAKYLSALECLKDGAVYDKRYVYKRMLFEPPHILVFSNQTPPHKMLTKDRWHIQKIQDLMETADPFDPCLAPSSPPLYGTAL